MTRNCLLFVAGGSKLDKNMHVIINKGLEIFAPPRIEIGSKEPSRPRLRKANMPLWFVSFVFLRLRWEGAVTAVFECHVTKNPKTNNLSWVHMNLPCAHLFSWVAGIIPINCCLLTRCWQCFVTIFDPLQVGLQTPWNHQSIYNIAKWSTGKKRFATHIFHNHGATSFKPSSELKTDFRGDLGWANYSPWVQPLCVLTKKTRMANIFQEYEKFPQNMLMRNYRTCFSWPKCLPTIIFRGEWPPQVPTRQWAVRPCSLRAHARTPHVICEELLRRRLLGHLASEIICRTCARHVRYVGTPMQHIQGTMAVEIQACADGKWFLHKVTEQCVRNVRFLKNHFFE